MENWKERTERIMGSAALETLAEKRVAVFGLGGVGGHAAEALARAGVGAIDLVDRDTVDETNRNRQLVALISTVGKAKTDVMRERILDIDPECRVTTHHLFYLPETAAEIDVSDFDFIIDAIDNVTAKLCLIERAKAAGVPLICSMGTGNRLDPSKLIVTDISKVTGDPLAKIMRKELKDRGLGHLTVVASTELPVKTGTRSPGSSPFVPAAAGLLLASYVVRELTGISEKYTKGT